MTPSFPSPQHLIAAIRAGDVAAFRTVYEVQFSGLCDYAATIVGFDDARDVVQDAFGALWRNRTQLTVATERELRYYLIRAVRNRAVDMQRHARVRLHAEPVVQAMMMEDVVMEEREESEGLHLVQRVIDQLPSRAREILLLRWRYELGLEEIARVMEISYGSARVLHTRALAMVRERMKGML